MRKFYDWMARDSSCVVRNGKSDKIRTMDKKMNTFNGEILNYQQIKIQKSLQGLTIENISCKPHLKQLKNEIELFHELQKFNKKYGTIRMSKKWKIKKMKLETEFFRNCLMDDYDEEEKNRRHAENFHLTHAGNYKIYEDVIRFLGLR